MLKWLGLGSFLWLLGCAAPELPDAERIQGDLVGRSVAQDDFAWTFESFSEIDSVEIGEFEAQESIAEIPVVVMTPDQRGQDQRIGLLLTYRLEESEWRLAALKLTEFTSDSTRFRQTVRDVMTVGIAVMAAMGEQPGLSSSGTAPFVDQRLYDLLHPHYMKDPILADAWGNPLEVFVNSNQYPIFKVLVRSAGSDGEWESRPYQHGTVPQGVYSYDIVWTDGYFLRDLR